MSKETAQVKLKLRNDEDNYLYQLTIFPDGNSSIQVTPANRQSISFSGRMDVKQERK